MLAHDLETCRAVAQSFRTRARKLPNSRSYAAQLRMHAGPSNICTPLLRTQLSTPNIAPWCNAI